MTNWLYTAVNKVLVFHEVLQPIYKTKHRIFQMRHSFGLYLFETDFVLWFTKSSDGTKIIVEQFTIQ